MCPHSCVDPSKLNLVKRISTHAADVLYEKFGGLPRFKSDALCSKCIEFLIKKKEFFEKLTEDLKAFSKCLKANYKYGFYYIPGHGFIFNRLDRIKKLTGQYAKFWKSNSVIKFTFQTHSETLSTRLMLI